MVNLNIQIQVVKLNINMKIVKEKPEMEYYIPK